MCLKGGTEDRGIEQRTEPGDHAAGQIDPAGRLEHQRDVAGEAAEQPDKQISRGAGGGVAGLGFMDDRGRGERRRVRMQGAVQTDEAWSGQEHFSRNRPASFGDDAGKYRHLVRRDRAERGMTTFAWNYLPT